MVMVVTMVRKGTLVSLVLLVNLGEMVMWVRLVNVLKVVLELVPGRRRGVIVIPTLLPCTARQLTYLNVLSTGNHSGLGKFRTILTFVFSISSFHNHSFDF